MRIDAPDNPNVPAYFLGRDKSEEVDGDPQFGRLRAEIAALREEIRALRPPL
ncbi:MAG: hypothetical protein ACR2GJ_10235 [Gemmatimonadaceae bacterium]|jgi:hypothetical protein